jgi:hypothetical protein
MLLYKSNELQNRWGPTKKNDNNNTTFLKAKWVLQIQDLSIVNSLSIDFTWKIICMKTWDLYLE